MSALTKTQVDRLGHRLKEGGPSEDDLRSLDLYRRSFSAAYESIVHAIRQRLELEPTGRPAKSTTSIVEKLQRETMRLTQMQDIAGCRLIVADVREQDRVVAALVSLFDGATIVDRRRDPSHGYRAVHVIAVCAGKEVEIQVRTSLQHLWAELSEKFSDVFDPQIKYGGGADWIRSLLGRLSALLGTAELSESELAEMERQAPGQALGLERNFEIAQLREVAETQRQEIASLLKDLIVEVERMKQ